MEVFGTDMKYTLKKNQLYDVTMTQDGNSNNAYAYQGMSDSKGVLVVPIYPEDQAKYHRFYSVEVSELLDGGATRNVVLIDSVTKVTPYATPTEAIVYMNGKITQPQAVEYERFARHLIDSIVGSNFQLERKTVHVLGNSTDSLLFDDRLAGKVFSIYENIDTPIYVMESPDFELQYVQRGESNYNLFLYEWNNNATQLLHNNRLEHTPTWPTRYSTPTFKYEYDYAVDAEFGWPVVQQDVKDATLLLISDISCGNNRYANKYIRQFSNGAQSIAYFEQVVNGTGNLLVDNTLEKYKMEAIRAKVL